MKWLRAALTAAFLATSVQAQGPTARIDVLGYAATLEPNLAEKTVNGRVSIDFEQTSAGEVEFDIGALTIDSVKENGASVEFSQRERKLRVAARQLPGGKTRRGFEIEYHGSPKYGLTFVPEKSQIYTIFSTDQWMPCINAPRDRATLRLTLLVSKDLVVIANGRERSKSILPDGRVRHEWQLDRPAPSFSFGFAAARFNEATSARGRIHLRFLSSEATAPDLSRIFTETGDMILFFEERSGVKYRENTYAQALVQDTVGQEMADFALMSDEYGQGVLADPQRVGLIAHELAHQWWGIGVTCEDWTHFWLNEGFATFMAAAYREKRFGRDVYLKDVDAWRVRYEKVKAAGKDRSLAFPDWNKPTPDDRALVYQKGALVLHELRQQLGDQAFWKGFRAYTRAWFGQSVTTPDFKMAMERSVRRDLSAFFDEWVHASKAQRP